MINHFLNKDQLYKLYATELFRPVTLDLVYGELV